SARPMFTNAKRRAFSCKLRFRASEMCSAISFQWPGGVTLWPGTSAQKWAYRVWSGVRVVLSRAPRLLVRLKSAAYRALSSAGGPGGRNCAALVMAQGVTWGHWGDGAG